MQTSFAVSAAERTELLRDPEAFARRAEQVLGSLLQELHQCKAEAAAQRVDFDQHYHLLERAHATMRDEHQGATARDTRHSTELGAAVEAKEKALSEMQQLSSELRSKEQELSRLREGEREAAEESKRLLEINERRGLQVESLEAELRDSHQQLVEAKARAQQLATTVGTKENESIANALQVGPCCT